MICEQRNCLHGLYTACSLIDMQFAIYLHVCSAMLMFFFVSNDPE